MKNKIEIWDNTELNKCVHTFELEDDEIQRISLRWNSNPRDSVFIDVENEKITIISASGTREYQC